MGGRRDDALTLALLCRDAAVIVRDSQMIYRELCRNYFASLADTVSPPLSWKGRWLSLVRQAALTICGETHHHIVIPDVIPHSSQLKQYWLAKPRIEQTCGDGRGH